MPRFGCRASGQDCLLLWRQRFAGRRDTAALLLKLINPSAQGRFDQAERTDRLGMAVTLIEQQVGCFALELRCKVRRCLVIRHLSVASILA